MTTCAAVKCASINNDWFIGPSTGWLAAKICCSPEVHGQILKLCSASAVELECGDSERLNAVLWGSADNYPSGYRSIHLGSFAAFSDKPTREQHELLGNIKRITEKYSLNGGTLHPSDTPRHVYNLLHQYVIPFGLENMDGVTYYGSSVNELADLLGVVGAKGVIDLQHCYEVAFLGGVSPLELAIQFAELMMKNGGISHLHVSGEVSTNGIQLLNHAQLTVATNREEVLNSLREVIALAGINVPIILEGDPLPGYSNLASGEELSPHELSRRIRIAGETIAAEIELVRGFLLG